MILSSVSEPWACVGRTELHKSKAGGRHLIKQAFLSYRETAELSRCCCMLILLKSNLATDRSMPQPPISTILLQRIRQRECEKAAVAGETRGIWDPQLVKRTIPLQSAVCTRSLSQSRLLWLTVVRAAWLSLALNFLVLCFSIPLYASSVSKSC